MQQVCGIQNATGVDFKMRCTKCDKLGYKVREGLQNATEITKCERDYEVQLGLQSETLHSPINLLHNLRQYFYEKTFERLFLLSETMVLV